MSSELDVVQPKGRHGASTICREGLGKKQARERPVRRRSNCSGQVNPTVRSTVRNHDVAGTQGAEPRLPFDNGSPGLPPLGLLLKNDNGTVEGVVPLQVELDGR